MGLDENGVKAATADRIDDPSPTTASHLPISFRDAFLKQITSLV